MSKSESESEKDRMNACCWLLLWFMLGGRGRRSWSKRSDELLQQRGQRKVDRAIEGQDGEDDRVSMTWRSLRPRICQEVGDNVQN